jgi:SAM-dependent methyltransferase
VYEWSQRVLGADAARRRFVGEFLRPRSGDRILDVGCGTGSLLSLLPADVDYFGFDLNPGYIREARRRHGGRGRFLCAGLGEEPEEVAGTFDLVVACAVLHHLEDAEALQLVVKARRALRAGGRFVTHDPVRHEAQGWVARLLVGLDRGRRVRTPEGYRELLAGGGFVQVETTLTTFTRVPYEHFVVHARKT